MTIKQQLQPDELTVACHVRAPLVLDPVDSKVETLRTCEENGDIGDLILQSWSDKVSLEENSPHEEVVDRFERFELWADAHGVSVRPPFSIQTTASLASDTPKRVLVTPILCLALYHDSQLLGVYPHSDGENTYTATDAIAELRTGTLPTLLGTAEPTASDSSEDTDAESLEDAHSPSTDRTTRITDRNAPSPTVCPDCENMLTNVQGILSCTGCDWTDTELDELRSPGAKLVYLSLVDGPVSVDSLQTTLDLKKVTLYGTLRTLTERGLVEQTDDERYRVRRDEHDERRSAAAPRQN